MPLKKAVRKTGRKKKSCESVTRKDCPSDQTFMLSCLGQLIGWLNLNLKKLIAALAGYEQCSGGLARWEDATACLKTMKAPITERSLPPLKLLLDPNNSGLVKVSSLYSDIIAHHQQLTQEKISCEGEVCVTCGLRLPPPLYADPCPRYVELHMVLAPFASSPSHPGHMTFLLQTSTTIQALQHLMHSSLEAMATTVAIFSEVKVQPVNRLPPHSTLQEVGVAGSEKTTPTKKTLFYDYIPVSVHCPVLMSDHYYIIPHTH